MCDKAFFDKLLFDKLISVTRICVNDRYYILFEYSDRISLQHVYFLPNGHEDRYKEDYVIFTSDQLLDLMAHKNDLYVIRMQEEARMIDAMYEEIYG